MELPLDHFRLIGVSPSATSEEILRAFQLRLDKTPDDGFSYEVLAQRSELLRLTADLLTNSVNRKQYEDLVLNGASGLELSSNREVAGLILLWESGAPKEAFKLARKALQPPQTPALGSTREADLTLLAALTSRDSAIEEQNLRCYANAADFLQEGILILQRMGKLSDLRQSLEDDLLSLLPFRILDFLSRDLNDYESHKRGLAMLENMIVKRGGLEGKNKSEFDKFFSQNDFEIFFQQIKPFLTVQEQIDLFLNLQKRGSVEAGFSAFLALTAIGFSRRKPEKLIEARKILKNLNSSELDVLPYIGCLDLLMGDVKEAELKFSNSSDENLKQWLNNYSGEKLEALCSYCKNWLENDVLTGYRDIEIDTVDLDSWFEDRDIQDFIEKIDKKSNSIISRSNFTGFAQNIKNNDKDYEANNSLNIERVTESNLPLPGGSKIDLEEALEEYDNGDENSTDISNEIAQYLSERYTETKFLFGEFIKKSKFLDSSSYKVYIYAFLVLFGFGIGVGFLKDYLKLDNVKPSQVEKLKPIKNDVEKINSSTVIYEQNSLKETYQEIKELKNASPSLDQLKHLIELWLSNKSKYLAGEKEIEISKIVKKGLIKRLNQERESDIKRNVVKKIFTEIESIELLSQTSSRIAVNVKMKYSESIQKTNGEIINETTFKPFLKVKYIFGFSKKSWKLVDYVSGV